MIGGADDMVERLQPIWRTVAPGMGDIERHPGRTGDPAPEEGWLHCGPSGAGHFVKMVHNGIEYGMMAAYGEGLNILKNANAGKHTRDADAETARWSIPSSINTTSTWVPSVRCGVAVRSSPHGCWTSRRLRCWRAPTLRSSAVVFRIPAKGAGQRSLPSTPECLRRCSPRLCTRASIPRGTLFANKVQSAMRKQFGGHDEKTV